jgi:hypothetical protein
MMSEIVDWLGSKNAISEDLGGGGFFISFGDDYDGPTELAVYDDGKWELSFESRVDEIYKQGIGLPSLKRSLKSWVK